MFALFGSDTEDEGRHPTPKQKTNRPPRQQGTKTKTYKKNTKEDKQKKKKEKASLQAIQRLKSILWGQKEQEYDLAHLVPLVYQNYPSIDQTLEQFEKEDDEGTIEYKQQLLDLTSERMQSLMSQMKYRTLEGQGQCIYKIGLEDCGKPLGLGDQAMLESCSNLIEMASRLGLEAVLIRVCQGHEGLIWELAIRKKQQYSLPQTNKLLLMGAPQSGKSTLLGVLLSGSYDDGEGAARMHVLNHKHEVLSGETSSMSMHLLGYDSQGNNVNAQQGLFGHTGQSWADIQNLSRQVLQLIDIGGKHKNQQQLIQGLLSQIPHYVVLVMKESPDDSLLSQVSLVTRLGVKLIMVITHQDDHNSSKIVSQVSTRLTPLLPYPLHLVTPQEQPTPNIIPLFLISSVTGYGIDMLHHHLSNLPLPTQNQENKICQMLITNKFVVNGHIVLGATVLQGTLKKYQKLLLGPSAQGEFSEVEITNVEVNRVAVLSASKGQSCSVIIDPSPSLATMMNRDEEYIKKGMVLMEPQAHPQVTHEFVVSLQMYSPKATPARLPYSYQPVLHFNNGRKSCLIKKDKKFSKSHGHRDKPSPEKLRHGSCHDENHLRYIKTLFFPPQGQTHRKTSARQLKLPEDYFSLSCSMPTTLRLSLQYQGEFLQVGQQAVISDDILKAIATVVEVFP